MTKLWLTKKDVCFLLGVSPATLDRWRFDDAYAHLHFPRATNVGYKVFWRFDVIEDFAERHLPKPA